MNDFENEWKSERDAFERTGVGRGTEIEGRGYLQQIFKRVQQRQADPSEYIEALMAALRDETFIYNSNRVALLPSSENDVRVFKDKLTLIPSLDFKNPVGLIFGYYVFEQGEISRAKLRRVEKAMTDEKFKDYFQFVTPPDIVRYARLWATIL